MSKFANEEQFYLAFENVYPNPLNDLAVNEYNFSYIGNLNMRNIIPLETVESQLIGNYYLLADKVKIWVRANEMSKGSIDSFIQNAYDSLFELKNSLCNYQELDSFCKQYFPQRMENETPNFYRNFVIEDLGPTIRDIESYLADYISRDENNYQVSPEDLELIKNSPYNEDENANEDIAKYVIGWRNFFMAKTLSEFIQAKDDEKDIHIIMGALHVEHFIHLLEQEELDIKIKQTKACFI